MTGAITCKANQYYEDGVYGINMNNSDFIGCNSIRFGDNSDSYTEGILFPNDALTSWDSLRASGGTFYLYANNAASYANLRIGSLYADGNCGIGTTTPSYKLHVLGDIHAEYNPNSSSIEILKVQNNHNDNWLRGIDVEFPNMPAGSSSPFLFGKANGTNNKGTISYIHSSSGSTSNAIGFGFYANDNILVLTAGKNVGINVGNAPSYRLHVGGDIYATGGVTSLSDIRKKDVISYELPLSVEQIAAAPTIRFTWKDKREEGEQVGTIAQYWEKVLPQVCKNKSGELSMSYGVAALIAATIDARKIVDHDRLLREQAAKISELENKCSFLEREVERLKCA